MKKIKIKKTLSVALLTLCVLLVIGCPAAPAVNDKYTVDMFTSPVKPTDIKATRGDNTITVSWTKDPTVNYYDLYKARNYNGEFTKFSTFYPVDYSGDEIVFVDDSDSAGSISMYYVVAVKNVSIGVGREKTLVSEHSDIAIGSTLPKVIAQAPRRTKELKLTWMDFGIKALEGALYPDFYYQVIRNDNVVFNTKDLEGDHYSWLDTTALPDTKYYYTVELYYDVGDGVYNSVSSNTIEFDTSVNYVPSPINPELVTITDKNSVEADGKLAVNDITLKWSYDVPYVLTSKVEDLIPQFKIERTLADVDDWKLVAYYEDITSSSVENLDDKEVQRYSYEYHDTSCLAGSSYKYRFTVRYKYGIEGSMEQDEKPVVLPQTAKTLALPAKFHLSDYPSDEELKTHKFDIGINWVVPVGHEKEGFSYIIEKTELSNGSATDTAVWTQVGEPVPVDLSKNGTYQIFDQFDCTLEEMSTYRDFSYRISISDGSLRTKEIVMDDIFHIKNIYEKFEIVKANTFNASIDRADGVMISWNVAKNHVLENLGNVDVLVEDLYFILSCDGVVIKEGSASDSEFVNVPTDADYVFSYLHEGISTGSKYNLEAIYKKGVPEEEFSFKTSLVSGKTLLAVDMVQAETSAADLINIVFYGDPAATSFQIHYRYEGDSAWLTDDTLVLTNDAVPEASENAVFDTVKYVFQFKLLADDSENRGRHIEFAITMTDKTGAASEVTEPMTVGSYFGSYGMVVTASQRIGSGTAISDKITLTWTPVEGASGYLVYRASDENADYVILEDPDFKMGSDGVSGYDRIEADDRMTGYFWYKVVPFKDDILPDLSAVKPVKGTFFEPPTGIKATKGSQFETIEITWNPVELATGYNVYRRVAGSADEWDKIATVGKKTKYVDTGLTIDGDFEYTVDAMYARKAISFPQNAFTEQENVGYAFFDVPANIKLIEEPGGKYVLEWLPVKGATSYTIKLDDKLENGKYIPQYVTVPATGEPQMRYVIENFKMDYKIIGDKGVLLNCKSQPISIAAENASVKIGNSGTSFVPVSNGIFDDVDVVCTDYLMTTLMNNLGVAVKEIDKGFGKDWWQKAAAVYVQDSTGTVKAESASGGGFDPSSHGYISITNFEFPLAAGVTVDISSVSNLRTYIDYGAGGFLGTDTLQKVTGTVNVNVDNVYSGISVVFNGVGARVNYEEGSYSVKYNDVECMKFNHGEIPYLLEAY